MSGVFGVRFGSGTAQLVIGLAAAAAVATLVPTPDAVRAVAVLAFALIAPGAAIAGLLRIQAAAPWAMVTLGGSLTVNVLASEAAALGGWWEPQILLLGLAAVCTCAGLLVRSREAVAP